MRALWLQLKDLCVVTHELVELNKTFEWQCGMQGRADGLKLADIDIRIRFFKGRIHSLEGSIKKGALPDTVPLDHPLQIFSVLLDERDCMKAYLFNTLAAFLRLLDAYWFPQA